LPVSEAFDGEPPRVRRLAIFGAMDDEDDARARLESRGRDERADAQALVHAAPLAATRSVVAPAHAAALRRPNRSSAAPRSSGIGGVTTMRSPLTGCGNAIDAAWSARRCRSYVAR